MNELVIFLIVNFGFPKSIYINYISKIPVFCCLKVSCHDMSLCFREPATVAMADVISVAVLLTLKSKTTPINGNIKKVKQCSMACARQRTSPNNVELFGD